MCNTYNRSILLRSRVLIHSCSGAGSSGHFQSRRQVGVTFDHLLNPVPAPGVAQALEVLAALLDHTADAVVGVERPDLLSE